MCTIRRLADNITIIYVFITKQTGLVPDEVGYWQGTPSLGASGGRSEVDKLWSMRTASLKRIGKDPLG